MRRLNIVFYAPFKPLDHPDPSGDRVIGAGLYRFLESRGHRLQVASRLRCRWIYWKPWLWPLAAAERRRLRRRFSRRRADLWLTYHSYYKGPDLLGPGVAGRLDIPYVIFQGGYATKYRRNWRTRPGFELNRRALQAAGHVFANKKVDLVNLQRLLPDESLDYVAPGIDPEAFPRNPEAGGCLRRKWRAGEAPVLLTAAMFRPGVKVQSLEWVIRACGRLQRDFRLVIVGDGRERARLEALAAERLSDKVVFAGRIPREEMHQYYSAADLFVFPGIGESLGMVFLEAQCCGLPVVACRTAGVPEVVADGDTGFLTPIGDMASFTGAVEKLLADDDLRTGMGRAARQYVLETHDLNKNYGRVEDRLIGIVERHRA
jgi:glycosyltransferase involved in cell wall biosynthesis